MYSRYRVEIATLRHKIPETTDTTTQRGSESRETVQSTTADEVTILVGQIHDTIIKQQATQDTTGVLFIMDGVDSNPQC
jgi:hypothetical protein